MTGRVHSDVRRLRAQVVLIVGLCLTSLTLLLVLVLMPLREEGTACRTEILNVEDELATFRVRMEDGGLSARLAQAVARNRRLGEEWARLRDRVDTFRDRDTIREALPTYEDGRIDFKVALFNARQQLADLAVKADVNLPADLGIPETIGSEERAELRLWQLAATVRLVELAIDARLPVVKLIASDRPAAFSLDDETARMALEFPTRMVVRCTFKHLVAFLDILSRRGSFYAIRKLRVERMGSQGDDMLEAEIVAGAFLFQNDQRGVALPVARETGAEADPASPPVGRRTRPMRVLQGGRLNG